MNNSPFLASGHHRVRFQDKNECEFVGAKAKILHSIVEFDCLGGVFGGDKAPYHGSPCVSVWLIDGVEDPKSVAHVKGRNSAAFEQLGCQEGV